MALSFVDKVGLAALGVDEKDPRVKKVETTDDVEDALGYERGTLKKNEPEEYQAIKEELFMARARAYLKSFK